MNKLLMNIKYFLIFKVGIKLDKIFRKKYNLKIDINQPIFMDFSTNKYSKLDMDNILINDHDSNRDIRIMEVIRRTDDEVFRVGDKVKIFYKPA